MTTPPAATSLRFGRFELQPHERRLLADGAAVTLGGRAFDLLLALAERAGKLVDKSTLLDLVWPGLVVQENNLAAQMSTLRKLLGEGVIATIPGRGYRFVARLQAAADAAAQAPAAPAPPRQPSLRTNLPAELPPLVGREAALAELAGLIDSQRLVSVLGAGGIGKSLLTQHALAARRDTYPHGVCWVELAALTDAAALPGAVAAALGVHGGQGDALASLVSAVSSLTMLLALDNAEHLLDAVAALTRALLDAAPGLRIVVTSQAPLKLSGEQLLKVEPLAVPDAAITSGGDTSLSAGDALHFGAVALFAERARAADRRFAVTDANVATVVRICRALDGLPLAIELAAARAPLLGLPRLLEGMQHRLALLTQGRSREAPPRQRTLRAALEWSHELLAPREQRAFRRLGVVAGSASLELVLALLAEEDGATNSRWEALDALDLLIERSLVALNVDEAGDDRGGEPRYRMLESPRAYALEVLDRCGERAALQRLHAHAMGALLDAAYADYFAGRIGADAWLRRLEPDLDNARDALRWAREAGDAALQLRIGSTMLRALPPSLHVERVALADVCEACIAPRLPEPLQLQAWIELSCVLADPQKQRARQAADRALVLARRLDTGSGDRFVLYHALARACSAAAQIEDLSAAQALLAELQPLEDPAWTAQRLLWGAEAAQWVARMSGQRDLALRIGRRLVALDRERGGHASIATGNLIDAEIAAGNVADAARLGEQLVASLRGTRHEYSLSFARINLMAALLALDDVERALPVARGAWAMAAAFELQHAAAAYLALLCALQGRAEAAVTLAAYSEAIYAARGEVREHNETAATERALALARSSLDDTAFERCRKAGAAMRNAEVEAVAFGRV